jgi:hypothetical protein
MSVRRLVLVLVTLLLSAAPVQAQTSSPDSVTLSEESIRDFQTALEEAQTSLANLNRAATSGSQASPGDTDGVDRTRIFNVLFLVLALSLVFESAMSVIFDWRLFIRYFEGRGVKTPLIVAVAFLVFLNYELDIVAELLRGFPQISGTIGDTSLPGQLLTALLIAGGSSGVFRIFARLGIRSPEERDKKAQQERALMEEAADTESSDTNS